MMTTSEFTEPAEAIREEKRAGPGGWLALMAVDLRVVAVKLTNRFRGAGRGEATSALLKHAVARGAAWDGRRGSTEGWRRAGSVGGQEIAVKQAWRDIKG